MLKLFLSNLKMEIRNKQVLFWSLMFPLVFTAIFGLFFGKDSSAAGTVALINQSDSALAKNVEKSMKDANLFKIQKETDKSIVKDLIKKNKINSGVIIPQKFGSQEENAPTKIKVIYDPGNATGSQVVVGLIDKILTGTNYQIQNAKPIYSIEQEKTNPNKLNYFDFILIGLLGMALMNSNIHGVSISMSKYREDQILKRLTTTPMKTWKFIIAEVLSRLLVNFVQVSLILVVGLTLFGAHIPGNIFMLYLFVLVGAILFQLIGFTLASFSKNTQAAEGMATAVTVPMMFLSGVFFPIDQLPKWIYSVVQYLPLSPLLNTIRSVGLNNTSPFANPTYLVIIFIWIIIALFISIYKFRLTEE